LANKSGAKYLRSWEIEIAKKKMRFEFGRESILSLPLESQEHGGCKKKVWPITPVKASNDANTDILNPVESFLIHSNYLLGAFCYLGKWILEEEASNAKKSR